LTPISVRAMANLGFRDTHQRVCAPFRDFFEPSRAPARKMSENQIERNTHARALDETVDLLF